MSQEKEGKTEPKIIVIVENGALTDVRIPKDMRLNIEAIQIDRDYPDYEKLQEYADKVYDDETMRSADFESVSFEEG